MLNSKLVKNIISLVVVALLVYFGYVYLTKSGSDDSQTGASSIIVQSSDGTSATSTTGDDSSERFLSLLQDIDAIDFKNVSLFRNPVFSDVLQDFSQELPNRPVVRSNPFAPVEGNVYSAVYSYDLLGKRVIIENTSSSSVAATSSGATASTSSSVRISTTTNTQ